MRIVVDVNHPAHVHFFKNFIWEMERRGHEVLVTASEKPLVSYLLDRYSLEYLNLGRYGDSILKKALNLPIFDAKMYRVVKKFDPDILVGIGSIRAPHVAWLLKSVSINFEDTEHSREQHLLYLPFVTRVLTPSAFLKDLGPKQVRYNGYHELAYLHPNYFKPDPSVLDDIGLSKGDTFIVLRFVSWTASHDVGQHGISNKVSFVKELEKHGTVLITSESKLPRELEKYRVRIPPERMHDLLYYATLYVGEGATMASEAAVLGTHAIYINTLPLGYLEEQEKRYQLVFNFNEPHLEYNAFEKAMSLLENNDLWRIGKIKREKLLQEKIDVTKFMARFIESIGEGG